MKKSPAFLRGSFICHLSRHEASSPKSVYFDNLYASSGLVVAGCLVCNKASKQQQEVNVTPFTSASAVPLSLFLVHATGRNGQGGYSCYRHIYKHWYGDGITAGIRVKS